MDTSYLVFIGVVLVIGLAVWDIGQGHAREFRALVERNRGLGLYRNPEFKKQTKFLRRVQLIAVLLMPLLGIPSVFFHVSDIVSVTIGVIGICLWVVIIMARSKWRKLMKYGIKKE